MTINQLKRLVALSLFCISISFLVFNCEKEDDVFTTEQQTTATKNYIAPHIVYSNEITSNPKLTQTLQHLKQLNCEPKTKSSTTLGNKLVYSEALNITIDDESAMYLENADGSYHSYTFQAIDHEHPYGVQNIVLSLMPDGTYREVLVRYEVEGNEEIAFRNGEPIDLTNKVSYAVLENGSFSSAVLSKVTTMDQCITITADQAGQVCKGEDAHTWDERNLCRHYPGPNGPTPSVPFTVSVDYACIDALVLEGSSEPAPSGSVPTQTNNGSVTTAPYVSPAELARRKVFRYSLSNEIRVWFDSQSTEYKNNIYTFLESELESVDDNTNIEGVLNYTEEASNEAKINIYVDYITNPVDPKWIEQAGMLQNNPALSYTHYYHLPNSAGSMFLMNNGLILNESVTRRQINTDTNIGYPQSTEAPLGNDNFYYVKTQGDDDWYEFALPTYGINFDCLSCALNDFAETILVNSLVITGRYFLPAEDVFILINGEDFYGAEQSRAVAGAFILVDIIPGSQLIKGIKLIKYGDEILQVAEAAVRYVDEIYRQQRELIERVLEGLEPLTNNTKRGNFGEIVVDVDLYEKGYESLTRGGVVDLTDTSIHANGIDNVIQNPQTGEYILIETKYNTATLGSTSYGDQMSEEWIEHHLENLGDLGQDILDAGYISVLAHVAPNGNITYSTLNSAGEVIGTWNP